MEKKNFLLDAAIGKPYGTVWEVRNENVVQIPYSVIQAEQLDIGLYIFVVCVVKVVEKVVEEN